jgi:hypothetical protein
MDCRNFVDEMQYQTVMNRTHSFSELNVSNILRNHFPGLALIQSSLVNGLRTIQTIYSAQHISITSAYRTPAVNNEIDTEAGSWAPRSRHVFGDAVDMATGGSQDTFNSLTAASQQKGNCIEDQNATGLGHVHVDWRQSGCKPEWLVK